MHRQQASRRMAGRVFLRWLVIRFFHTSVFILVLTLTIV